MREGTQIGAAPAGRNVGGSRVRRLMLPLILIAAISAVVLILFLKSRSGERADAFAISDQQNETDILTSSAPRLPVRADTATSTGNEQLPSDRFGAWLEESNRSAEAVLAVYELSPDPTLREELATKWGHLPEVSLVLALTAEEPEEMLEWADRLPPASDNIAGPLIQAAASLRLDRREDALDSLDRALAGGELDLYSGQRNIAKRAALIAAGKSPTDAAIEVALGSGPESSVRLLQVLTPVRSILKDELTAAGSYGDSQALGAWANGAKILSEKVVASANDSLLASAWGILLERDAVAALPSGTPYAQDGETAGQRLEALDRELADLMDLNSQLAAAVSQADEKTMLSYAERYSQTGALKAVRWLVNRSDLTR